MDKSPSVVALPDCIILGVLFDLAKPSFYKIGILDISI